MTAAESAEPNGDAAPVPRHVAAGSVLVEGRLSAEQIAAVTELCARAAEADGVYPLSEHVSLHLRYGGEDRDFNLLAVTPDGDLAGYAHLDPTDQVAGAAAEIVVHPGHRRHGYGRLLVGTAERQAGGTRLRLWAHGDHPAARSLALSLGYVEIRRLLQLRRSLLSPLPELVLPEGIRLRAFQPGQDDDTWLALNAKAFAHHPEQGGWTAADLHARMREDWFDPAGFLLAEQAGPQAPAGEPRVVGFHWTKVHGSGSQHGPGHSDLGGSGGGHGHEPIGEVYVVGVDPDSGGRGIGRAITLAGLLRMRSQGLTQAMLYVEGDNEAALAVYERLGFTRWDTDVMFLKQSAAVTPAADSSRAADLPM
jgi:mycothiol synthase